MVTGNYGRYSNCEVSEQLLVEKGCGDQMKYMIVVDEKTTEKGIQMASEMEQRLIQSGHEVYLVRLEQADEYAQVLGYCYGIQPDRIITYDCAGFYLRDETGELLYNKLYAQNEHILTKSADRYQKELKLRMSYPTTVYVEKEKDQEFIQNHFFHVYGVELCFDVNGEKYE